MAAFTVPAIFRIHYEGHEYVPHVNHVALDDKLFNYEVSRFTHQFAGLICIQNSTYDGNSPQAIIHRCVWSSEVHSHLSNGTYYEYAAQNKIEQQQIEVQPGDFYLFNSGCIHLVAPVEGILLEQFWRRLSAIRRKTTKSLSGRETSANSTNQRCEFTAVDTLSGQKASVKRNT